MRFRCRRPPHYFVCLWWMAFERLGRGVAITGCIFYRASAVWLLLYPSDTHPLVLAQSIQVSILIIPMVHRRALLLHVQEDHLLVIMVRNCLSALLVCLITNGTLQPTCHLHAVGYECHKLFICQTLYGFFNLHPSAWYGGTWSCARAFGETAMVESKSSPYKTSYCKIVPLYSHILFLVLYPSVHSKHALVDWNSWSEIES